MVDEIGPVGSLRPQDVALCTLLRALGTPQQARTLPLNSESSKNISAHGTSVCADVIDHLQDCITSSKIFRKLLQVIHSSSALSKLSLSQLLAQLQVGL